MIIKVKNHQTADTMRMEIELKFIGVRKLLFEFDLKCVNNCAFTSEKGQILAEMMTPK